MSTERLTPESLEKTIAAAERIIFSSPIGLSGRSISSTAVKSGTSLANLAELGAIWGEYTLAAGDRFISVTWSEAFEGDGNKYVANLQTGDQRFDFDLTMPEEESDQIVVGNLREVVS
jgi:hypothetical protein